MPGRAARRKLYGLGGGVGVGGSFPLSSGRLSPASRVCQNRDVSLLEGRVPTAPGSEGTDILFGLVAKGNQDQGTASPVGSDGCLQPDEDMGPSVVAKSLASRGRIQTGAGDGRGGRQEVPGGLQSWLSGASSFAEPDDAFLPVRRASVRVAGARDGWTSLAFQFCQSNPRPKHGFRRAQWVPVFRIAGPGGIPPAGIKQRGNESQTEAGCPRHPARPPEEASWGARKKSLRVTNTVSPRGRRVLCFFMLTVNEVVVAFNRRIFRGCLMCPCPPHITINQV